jgi:Tol biopolymer transport system component/DNA-binding winged helix-turn-helix (wHTH) protein
MGTTTNPATIWRFGVFEFDARCGELRRAGVPIKLRDQSSRILAYLLEHAGQMVTREELRQYLWPSDTYVDFDHSLNTAVMKLREALGDSADKPLYIETIPRRGYRFVAPVLLGVAVATRNGPARPPGLPAVADSEEADSGAGGAEVINAPAGDAAGKAALPGVVSAGGTEEKRSKVSKDGGRHYHRWLLFGLVPLFILVVFLAPRIAGNRDRSLLAVRPGVRRVPSRMQMIPLTNLPGAIRDPALSPDGEKIAFIWDGENAIRGDLYVELVGGEKPLRLTHTGSGSTCCADWSPDGREIVFSRCDDNGGGVFIVPALGGSERRLTDVACPGYPKWVEDGRSLVLADRCTPGGPGGIVVFSLTTGAKRCLHSPPSGDVGDMAPAVSPDQKSVAFASSSTASVAEIYTVPLSGGNPRQITHEGMGAWGPMWSPDGRDIIFNSARSGLNRVWRVPAAGGTIEQESVYPGTGTLSRDGRRLAYVEPRGFWDRSAVISRMTLSGAGGQVISQEKIVATGGNDAPQPSPDGRQIIFQSDRTGRNQIWRSDADGSSSLQMTFFDKGHAGTPRWSPDGKWVAFDYEHEAHRQIYLIDSEGRNMRLLTSGNYENVVPGWSRDGMAVYFASNRTGALQVWRRELLSGRETQETYHGGFAAFESYDAKTLYYSKYDGGGLWSMPVGGGEEQQVTDALHRGYWGHFAVTDKGLYLLNSDTTPKATIMFYNFQTHLLTPVIQIDDPAPWTANLASSRDGRTVWFAQAAWHSSITMAENLQ